MFGDSNSWIVAYPLVHEHNLSLRSYRCRKACLQWHLPADLTLRHWPRHSLPAVFNAIFSLLGTGRSWRHLPCDFPPWQTVHYHSHPFRLTGVRSGIRTALRMAKGVGRDPQPSAAIMDVQSIKTVEESASISGDDGHKRVKGRERHLLVDTLGLPISISVTPADTNDKVGAWRLLAGLKPLVPRLAKIWANGAYTSRTLPRWCEEYGGWGLEIVGRDPEPQGFAIQPQRWVVERSFAWPVRNRRLRINYKRRVPTSETLVEVATIRLLVRRLARCA